MTITLIVFIRSIGTGWKRLLTGYVLQRRFFATADKMGIEGYHNYTICLRLKRKKGKDNFVKFLLNLKRLILYRIVTHQTSQRMVRHISRGIAKGVSAAVAENDRRPRRLHGDQHRGHGYVRQIHHHPESIHLQHDTLETSSSEEG